MTVRTAKFTPVIGKYVLDIQIPSFVKGNDIIVNNGYGCFRLLQVACLLVCRKPKAWLDQVSTTACR